MDTVTGGGRRAELRQKLDTALGAMHRAASASALKDDPLAEQLQALAASIGALSAIYEASADTQVEIADTLRTQADAVAGEAIVRVHAAGVGIIDQLAPRLAAVVETVTRAQAQTARLRVLLGSAAVLVLRASLIAGVAYSAGFIAGRSRGEIAAHAIAAAMAAGPGAATAWASLMADNDPVQALAVCRRSIMRDAHGADTVPCRSGSIRLPRPLNAKVSVMNSPNGCPAGRAL